MVVGSREDGVNRKEEGVGRGDSLVYILKKTRSRFSILIYVRLP